MTLWRIGVTAPDGTSKPNIDVDGAVARLTSFSVDGAGNCLEAEFQADPQQVDVDIRDIITLSVTETEDTADLQNVYRGVVMVAGNGRAETLQTFRAVGLKKRFYEVTLYEGTINSDDVAAMVDEALADAQTTIPEGVSYSSSNVPTLNFELGNRYPQLETLGDFLDALADTVGRFIVPSGSSYSYDGETYGEGETVPAVRWGTDASGNFFFRRPQASSVSVSEGDLNTLVRWDAVSGEDVVDSLTIVYASERMQPFTPQAHLLVPDPNRPMYPIHRIYGSGNYESNRVLAPDNPIDYMKNTIADVTASNVNNVANAWDGDTGTHATAVSDAAKLTVEAGEASPGDRDWIATVDMSPDTTDESRIIKISLVNDPGGSFEAFVGTYHIGPVEEIVDQSGRAVFHFPGVADAFQIDLVTGDEVNEVYVYRPDDEVGQRTAEAYEVTPETNASEVELVNQIGSVSQTLALTPNGESEVEVPIERVEYSLTNERGLITRYFLGQQFDAELLSQKAVLDRLVDTRIKFGDVRDFR